MKSTKLVEVEDLYRPFKEKKKTKATEAIKNGLEGLSKEIMAFPTVGNIENIAKIRDSYEQKLGVTGIAIGKDIFEHIVPSSSSYANANTQNEKEKPHHYLRGPRYRHSGSCGLLSRVTHLHLQTGFPPSRPLHRYARLHLRQAGQQCAARTNFQHPRR